MSSAYHSSTGVLGVGLKICLREGKQTWKLNSHGTGKTKEHKASKIYNAKSSKENLSFTATMCVIIYCIMLFDKFQMSVQWSKSRVNAVSYRKRRGEKELYLAFHRSPAWLFPASLKYSSLNTLMVGSPNTQYCLQRRFKTSKAFLDDNFSCDNEGM